MQMQYWPQKSQQSTSRSEAQFTGKATGTPAALTAVNTRVHRDLQGPSYCYAAVQIAMIVRQTALHVYIKPPVHAPVAIPPLFLGAATACANNIRLSAQQQLLLYNAMLSTVVVKSSFAKH
jgi:hypothetical protein